MRRVLQKPKNVIWTPHPGSQVDFLECPVHEVLLHGNRGGGKTDVLLMDFLQDVGQGYGQDWRGILFREEYTQLTDIINKSKKWISQIFPGAKWNGTNHSWVFPEGETLYLRYMRVPGDYWGYHGHEYPWCVLGTTKVLMSDMSVKPMIDVRVGDYVHTLEGPKKVLRVTRSIKDAVKLNFYSCGELVGTQVQGLEHRLLTTDGMLDVSTLDLNHAALQSQLFQSAWSAYKYPEYARRYTQLLLSSAQKIQNFLEFFSLLPTYLDTQVTLSYSYRIFLQSSAYQLLCMSYKLHASLNLKIQENYAYAIDDHNCRINTESILQDIRRFSVTCSHFFVKLQGLLHQRISFPAFCYGYNCDNAGLLIQDYLTHCLGNCSHNDAQVHLEKEIFQDIVPQFYDAPKHIESALFCKDDLVNTQRSNLPKGYVHPYSGEFRSCMYQTSQVAYPLAESPIHNCDLIDITVADCSHYITELSVSQLRNEVVNVSHRNYLINKNCGWEELTNWATDECYKIMMSTNRSSNPSVPRKVRATCNPAGVGHCVPYGEVLTPTGWVDIKEIQVGATVFTVDSAGTLLKSTVEQVHSEEYNGKIATLQMKGHTFESTPQHKMPKLGGVVGKREQKFTLLPIEDLPGEASILRTVSWNGTELPSTYVVPSLGGRQSRILQPTEIPMDDYLELLGWFLSEGGTVDRDKLVGIAKTDIYPEAKKEIKDLLDRCLFDYGVHKGGFTIYAQDWWGAFREFGGYTDKYIPENIKNATTRELKILFSSLMRGDGSWKKSNKEQPAGHYWTTSKRLAEDVAEIAIKLGYIVTTHTGKRDHQTHICYTVSFRSGKGSTFYTGNHRYEVNTKSSRANINYVDYSGKVYCIGVPDTHTFILRQKGSIWISGNSWVKHRFIDVAPPKVLYRDPETGKGRVHIVSSLAENTTLLDADPNYQKTIISAVQDDPAKRKAWIEGSWDIIDGGFFSDLWKDGKTHIIKKFPFPKSWDVIRSFDWGSSKPWSVTYVAESNGEQPDPVYGLPYLPKGSCICIMEIYGWNGTVNTGDQATSQDIAERTLAVDAAIQMEFGCRVRIGPADTSIWEVRDGTSIAKNMSDHGLWWHKAYKGSGSRVSGWAIIRTMLGAANRRDLEHPHLYFFETCRHHIRTIQVMQHDKNKPEDLDSSLEDHCFTGDTKVITSSGCKSLLSLVGTSGSILSVNGEFQKYHNCRLIKKDAIILRITFADGFSVKCTPDHKFLASTGFVEAKDLLTLSGTYCIVSKPLKKEELKWKKLLLYQKLNSNSLKTVESLRTSGMVEVRGGNGIRSTTKKLKINYTPRMLDYVQNVVKSIIVNVKMLTHFAPIAAKPLLDENPELTVLRESVQYAINDLLPIKNQQKKLVAVHATQNFMLRPIQIEYLQETEDVYCLEVHNTQSFALENGLIVSNCMDSLRYGLARKLNRLKQRKVRN